MVRWINSSESPSPGYRSLCRITICGTPSFWTTSCFLWDILPWDSLLWDILLWDSLPWDSLLWDILLWDNLCTIPLCPMTSVGCVSDTGSGKSTQLPTYLLQSIYLNEKDARRVTRPQRRQVAARSVTTRVAETNGFNLGVEVGFRVRFNSKSSGAMCLVHDGRSALKEVENDRYLSKCSCVIADEVHERGIDTDLLMGILKMTLKSCKDLKVIIMSATLMANFDAHFQGAGVLFLAGPAFPVSLSYIKEATPDVLFLSDGGHQHPLERGRGHR